MSQQPTGVRGQHATTIAELLPLLTRFCAGEYGIALGGAHAKGMDDPASDLDLYVFAHEVLTTVNRARLCETWGRAGEVHSVTCWGDGGRGASFVQGGADFYYKGQKVECWLRNIDYIEGIIEECRQGVVRHDLVTWTVMGFYNHCALSDLDHMVLVDDPFGVLARWKQALAVYPPRLREAIIARHLGAAKFWPRNFHYLSAIERGDVFYVQGIVHQVLHNLFQVLFALNEVYFPGDKKLEAALAHLPVKPQDFTARARHVLVPEQPVDRTFLDGQCQELNALVNEIEVLTASS